MFEIKWKDKIYKFDEEISNAIFRTVKGKDLTAIETMIVAMSVEPKITVEQVEFVYDDVVHLITAKKEL